MNEIPNQIRYLYHDNSLFKSQALSRKVLKNMRLLPEKLKNLKEKSILRVKISERYQVQYKWESMIRSEINSHYSKLLHLDKSALVIQKHARGFLARIRMDPLLLNQEEDLNKKLLQSMDLQVEKISFGIEVLLLPPILLIQKSFRRYLTRKKIALWQGYLRFLELERETKAENALKKWICVQKNRNTVRDLKFAMYKKKRLVEIREKVAILYIKKVWRHYGLNFMAFKERISRFKRRQSLIISREKYKQYLSAFNGTKKVEKISDSLSENSSEISLDAQVKETEKIKEMIQKKIRDKISKGKISYSVNSIKAKMILPIMGEKMLNVNKNRRANSKVFDITDSSNSKSNIVTRCYVLPKRQTTIFSPTRVTMKKSSLYQRELSPLVYHSIVPIKGIEIKRNYKSFESIEYGKLSEKNRKNSAGGIVRNKILVQRSKTRIGSYY